MAAISTILGLLPIALGFGAGGAARAPMGVFASTALTLLVIPVVYTLLHALQAWIFRHKRLFFGIGLLLLLAAGGFFWWSNFGG